MEYKMEYIDVFGGIVLFIVLLLIVRYKSCKNFQKWSAEGLIKCSCGGSPQNIRVIWPSIADFICFTCKKRWRIITGLFVPAGKQIIQLKQII